MNQYWMARFESQIPRGLGFLPLPSACHSVQRSPLPLPAPTFAWLRIILAPSPLAKASFAPGVARYTSHQDPSIGLLLKINTGPLALRNHPMQIASVLMEAALA